MALTKKDLVKIKDVVLEVMEPMMVVSQNEFSKIDGKFLKVGQQFSKIDDHFEKVHEEIKEKFDKVLNGQDKIIGKLDKLSGENIASIDLYKKQEGKLENHELRIAVVEEKVGVETVK